MEQTKTENEAGGGLSDLTEGLDAYALSEAVWTFFVRWNNDTSQAMTDESFNNLKPMIAASIKKYVMVANAKVNPAGVAVR